MLTIRIQIQNQEASHLQVEVKILKVWSVMRFIQTMPTCLIWAHSLRSLTTRMDFFSLQEWTILGLSLVHLIKRCIVISIIKLWHFINKCSLFIHCYSMLSIKIRPSQNTRCTWINFILFQSENLLIIQITRQLINTFLGAHWNVAVDSGRANHSRSNIHTSKMQRIQNLIQRVLRNQMETVEVLFFSQLIISIFRISMDQPMSEPKIRILLTILETSTKSMLECHLIWASSVWILVYKCRTIKASGDSKINSINSILSSNHSWTINLHSQVQMKTHTKKDRKKRNLPKKRKERKKPSLKTKICKKRQVHLNLK